ncbi:MAG: UrcA family protein [Pseudomonadota bacterium]
MRLTLPLIALAALAAPVAANDTVVVEEVRVSFADVDITSAAGRAELEERLEAKLRKACTIDSNSRYGYGRKIVDQKCFSDARADAMEAITQVAAREARGGRQASAN